MKPLHFRLISLIFLLIGANIEALQSEQNDRVNIVLEFPGNELDFFLKFKKELTNHQQKENLKTI